MRTLSTILLVASLAAPGAAQAQNIVYHDDNVTTTGRANAFPFGSPRIRQQQLVPQSVLGATPALIQDVFVLPTTSTSRTWTESEVVYDDIEIQAGTTTLTTLTTSWTQGSSNLSTIYRGPLRVRYLADQWVPLGLPNPIPWTPASAADNLLIDFIVWQIGDTGSVTPDPSGYFMWARTSGSSAISRAFLLGWTNNQAAAARNDMNGDKLGFLLNDGNFVVHGGGCTGSSGLPPTIDTTPGSWPQLGGSLDVHLRDGPPQSFVFLSMGFEFRGTATGLQLPLDLRPIGAPGCFMWNDVVATTPALNVDASGSAFVSFGVAPNPTLLGARLYTSWICLDPAANALGFTSSGYATVILGT